MRSREFMVLVSATAAASLTGRTEERPSSGQERRTSAHEGARDQKTQVDQWSVRVSRRRLDERIEVVSAEIETLSQNDAACQRLMTVPGIGPIISSAVVAAIGTGSGFKQGRDFAAWLGLVPKQESTGDRTKLGRISKRGNKYLRTLFVQAAHVVLQRRPATAMPALWPWIDKAPKRLAHRNLLAIALANKLARIAWAVLARGRHYEPRITPNAA